MDVNLNTPFWQRVEAILHLKPSLSPERVHPLIQEYVYRLTEISAIDLIEHNDPEDVAQAVFRSRRRASDYPLPGGEHAYFNTLLRVLEHVGEDGSSVPATRAWYLAKYDITGPDALDGYIAHPRNLGLYQVPGGRITLTNSGRRLLSTATRDLSAARHQVAQMKSDILLGYREIIAFVSVSPRRPREIAAELARVLGVGWKTRNQVTFRLNWLKSLELIEGDESRQKIVLTADGNRFARELATGAEIGMAAHSTI